MTDPEARRLVVDGEEFEVTRRGATYDLAWVSGPNPGYGFSGQSYGGGAMSEAELEGAARTFLKQVDPGTGYIE